MLGVTVAPVSDMVEYPMLVMCNGPSPLLDQITDWVTPPACSPVITPLKEMVFGLTASRGASESPLPFKDTGVDVEKPVAPFDVPITTSLDRGPGVLGAKTA